jgi:hypothetical protein
MAADFGRSASLDRLLAEVFQAHGLKECLRIDL